MYGSARLLLPRRTIIAVFGMECKEKRICGYNPPQSLVFLSVQPDIIERDPRVGLSRTFRTVTMGNFPLSTQRTSCHFITRCFTYFYRTRTSGGFPRIYTDLSYCKHSPFLRLALSGEFLPAFVSARGTQRNRDLRVISALSILGNSRPLDFCVSPVYFETVICG